MDNTQGRGGSRPNSGRKPGSGRYGCKTVAVRVPEHLVQEVNQFCALMMSGYAVSYKRIVTKPEVTLREFELRMNEEKANG